MAEGRWEQAYNGLADDIRDGQLQPGDAVPTEAELKSRFNLGRTSVRTALQHLEARGVVSRARGPYGRVVRSREPILLNMSKFERGKRRDDPETGTDEWAADLREQGRNPSETVDVHPELSRADIASYLGVATDTWLIRRRRFRYADGELLSVADTWMLDEIAKLPATDMQGKTVYPFMAPESCALPGGFIYAVGIQQTWVEDRHFARLPSPEEAELLDIAADTPVAEIVRIGYQKTQDTELSPFRVLHTVSPGSAIGARYWLRITD